MEHIRRTTVVVAAALLAAGLGAGRGWPAGDEAKKEAGKAVTVLRDEDCGSPAMVRIKEVAARLGLDIQIVEVNVTTQEQAEKLRYLGSPTVQIRGLDIDPKARGRTSYVLG